MKRLIFYILFTAFGAGTIFTACQKDTVAEPEKPKADFEYLAPDSLGVYQVKFTNTSKNATTYAWDFGDGTQAASQNPTHTYPSAGYFTVRLTATGAGGTDRTAYSVYLDETPRAKFGVQTCDSLEFAPCDAVFSDSSINAATFAWDFGDGVRSTDRHPRHRYQKPGIYTVRLRIANTGGLTADAVRTVKIAGPPPLPIPDFEIDGGNCTAPCKLTFTNISENAEKYFWDFGDGGKSIDTSPSHVYETGGLFTVRLTAEGPGGRVKKEKIVHISLAPTANFEIKGNFCAGPCVLTFSNLSQNALLYSWDFGDGRSSTEKEPSHQFTTAGTYTVKLKALAADGKSDQKERTVYIR